MSPFRPPNQSHRLLVAGLVLALLSAGCAKADSPGVRVKTIASDIVFNAKAPEPEAVPTLALPPATDGTFGDVVDSNNKVAVKIAEPEPEEEEEEAPAPTAKPRPTVTAPPPPAKIECPEALATAFPRDAATFDVPRTPAAGDYRWKRTVKTPVGTTKNSITQVAFNRHQISNVSKVTELPNPNTPDKPTRTFTYDEAAFFVGSSVVTTYQVKDNPPQQTVGLQTGQKATTGAPDRGVAITKVLNRDANNKPGQSFSPSTPVLVLPLPVAVPTDFESVGVDPTTGASLAIRGTVTGKDRVDACGDIVDGWRVKSTQTFTRSDGARSISDVDYFVATQLGGIIIFQNAVAAEAVRSANDPTVTDSLAQLDPTKP